MARKIQKAEKGKKRSKKKNLIPDGIKTPENANNYKQIKKALKRINLKRIIIDAPDK